LRRADAAGRSDAFETGGDVDAVAEQVAIGLHHHVAEVNADAELDPFLRYEIAVADRHAALHLEGERTASTTLANSFRMPSPVVLTMRPRLRWIAGSISSTRNATRRRMVPSSFAPVSRE
jgi:hypothetical protein